MLEVQSQIIEDCPITVLERGPYGRRAGMPTAHICSDIRGRRTTCTSERSCQGVQTRGSRPHCASVLYLSSRVELHYTLMVDPVARCSTTLTMVHSLNLTIIHVNGL